MEVNEANPQSLAVGTISLQYMIAVKAKGGVLASISATLTYCWFETL